MVVLRGFQALRSSIQALTSKQTLNPKTLFIHKKLANPSGFTSQKTSALPKNFLFSCIFTVEPFA
ncbi:hypothetical protein REPUB_Repub01dG0183300 [Reevesia pubescens]